MKLLHKLYRPLQQDGAVQDAVQEVEILGPSGRCLAAISMRSPS